MKTKQLLFSLLTVFSLITTNVFSQETSATLSGNVSDEKGTLVQGATILVKHEPTGATYTTQTNKKGLFSFPTLKAGGPYTITVSFTGFSTETFDNVSLTLGNNPDVSVVLKQSTKNLEAVVVSGAKRSSGIGRAQLNALPTIGRSLSDFTRLTPQSNNNSYGGSNFRYNNLTIDGAANNDAIGFSNSFGGVSGGGQSGAAGAGTRTNPYSLDVIQEVQVQLAPYDVKIGNFTGGSVNAVTKSGGNDFHGSIYAYGHNQALVGTSVDGKNSKIYNTYYDHQYGATLSGPIMKNKAFFIVNYEGSRNEVPTFYNAGDPGAAMTLLEAQQITNALKKYNFSPGTYGPNKVFTNSDKVFGRLDFNLNNKNSLTLRGIYTSGSGNNIERTTTNFQFSSTDFTQHTDNLNLVAELKSKINNEANNQLIVSYIKVHEYRDFPAPLDSNGNASGVPASAFVDIDNGRIWLGTWREAAIYNMKQSTVELTDNFTLNKGINKFTFGTHNEIYDLSYGFINSWNGRWEYAGGLNSFLADNPSRIRSGYTFDSTKNNRNGLYNDLPGSNFTVGLFSVYAQDEIAVNKRFKITPGVRFDYSKLLSSQFPLDPALNGTRNYVAPADSATYSHTPFSQFNNKWLGQVTISPRLGFSFDVKGNQSLVIRGGTGIFVGRMPFAWMGYAATLSGANLGNVDYKPSSGTVVPLAVDPTQLISTLRNIPAATNATKLHEVDLIDNNFKLPTVWRSNIAVDVKFGKGYKATFDAMYTKTLYDVMFQQINIKDSGVQYFSTGPTQTPYYATGAKNNSAYTNIYFLTNTTQGYRYNLTAQINKTSDNIKLGAAHSFNYFWSAAYTYGMSKDVSNGIRNSFQSNYELNPTINPENSPLAFSNFDLRHRIVATLGGSFRWNDVHTSSIAFFYSNQSGSPYSLIYTSAPFGNSSNAPLVYIPKAQSDINLADYKKADGTTYTAAQQWTDLNNFINGDDYLKNHRGEYAERNGLRTPWNQQLDMKLQHEIHLSKTNKFKTLVLSFDMLNVLNFINNNWGHIYFVTNVNNYTVNFLKFVKDANGKAVGTPASGYLPTFNYLAPPAGSNNQYYTVDPLNSRWQGQMGVKFNF
ncbi:TonB-dependent receptor [Ferruginibacter albus]|uniref:TonB-dependent receptor n=1 Tax=Ferruginibacter albus TaxID=2875540 RepID=UPI001CC7D3CA|nr:carboxypeptidase regulatory-like domain-containing protein [Ferruginibacter albus]UAY52364.1 carboxypeptidase regulatory-like domain-containing protein [Ferruginibacter albus]